VFFQAAIKFVQSHLNGTFRLIVSPGSPAEGTRSKVHGVRLTPYLIDWFSMYLAPCAVHLSCAYPVMTIEIVGAFKTHLRQYCGPERTPPGCSGSAQFGNGFMTQDADYS
jgi:hypothetical protein